MMKMMAILLLTMMLSTESSRQRAYSLVAQAYTSITAEDFAAFVGYSVEEAVKGEATSCRVCRVFMDSSCFPSSLSGVVSQGWQADPATRMVMPKKPGRGRRFPLNHTHFSSGSFSHIYMFIRIQCLKQPLEGEHMLDLSQPPCSEQ